MPAATDAGSLPDATLTAGLAEAQEAAIAHSGAVAVELDGDAVTISEPPAQAKTFADFGIAEPICAALTAAGITTAFPIQALTLPIALDEHDVIGQARTGTGKTFAFGIPILERMLQTAARKQGRAASTDRGAHP